MTEVKPKIAMSEEERKYRMRAGAFLASVSLIAAIAGFGKTISIAKKKDPTMFNKGFVGSIDFAETGTNLAMRALGWGTLYAFLGTGTLCYGVWKLSGASNFQEFREKMGRVLPRLSKNEPASSRTEFEGLTDLMNYISTWKKE